MVLKRKIEQKLNNWLNTKTGLLVDGSRQVGKTYILKRFAKKNFKVLIYINLIENKNALNILSKSVDSKDFIFRLQSIVDTKLIKRETCIFIDEIQEFKNFDFITLSKFLIDEGSYRYIFSGSMLGVELNDANSYPVGYVTNIKMFPLDFEEFCINKGIDDILFDKLKYCFKEKCEIEDYIHEKFMNVFREYLVIGGMPEIVSSYLDGNSLNEIDLIANAIVSNNRKDITKYVDKNKKLKIKEIYDLIPYELNKQNKRFMLNDIKNRNKNLNLSDDFLWVKNAGLAIPVYNAKDLSLPLIYNTDRNIMKVFYEDVGLLNSISLSKEIRLNLLKENMNINFGSIYENYVAEEFNSHSFDNIYYYNNKKNGEIDFIVEKDGKVIPIEIKSGKDYKRHSAINNILNIDNYNINEGFVFYNRNIKIDNKIIYFPIYLTSFI